MRSLHFCWITFFLNLAGCHEQAPTAGNLHSENAVEAMHTNALINEASPYLQQHAHNPVDWLPWGEAAFERARREDKLVLVSIGYSSCHWCHVMEHESFEDSAVAALMNKRFVCIKVDREERPDVDEVYMTAVQLMTRQGGWPLNCFTLPDGRPVYGGTYFPKDNWVEILENLAGMYANQREKMLEYADQLTSAVQQSALISLPEKETPLKQAWLAQQVNQISRTFDADFGGHQRAPKFPLPSEWRFLLQYGYLTADQSLADHVHFTLRSMANGGIYDQVGGGFARYSTDRFWKVPHFEKMLYDNGQLLSLYSEAYRHRPDRRYQEVVSGIVDFLVREMRDPEGGLYAALDADSEGEEGKFYVWTQAEMQSVLSEKEWQVAQEWWSFNGNGFWENDHYIPLVSAPDEQWKQKFSLNDKEWQQLTDTIREKALHARSHRERPGLDDKVITSWNALAIEGLADAYVTFGEQRYLEMAQQALKFLTRYCLGPDLRVRRYYKQGGRNDEGFLEDYAYLISALLRMYEVTGDENVLYNAEKITERVLHLFGDHTTPFFRQRTADGDSLLPANPIGTTDDVVPSPNAVMARNLYQLGTILYRSEWRKRAIDMIVAVVPQVDRYPVGYANWMQLAQWEIRGFHEVAVVGDKAADSALPLMRHYSPNQLTVYTEGPSDIPMLKGKQQGRETWIYVCHNRVCQKPVQDVAAALEQLTTHTEP